MSQNETPRGSSLGVSMVANGADRIATQVAGFSSSSIGMTVEKGV